MPADLPVAAPDHADEIRAALKALRGWLPEPQNKAASGGYDAEIVKVRRAHKAGLAALDALLAERQQDKERIERVTALLHDWVKAGEHTQEWQFYISKLFAAVEEDAENG